MDRPIAKEIAWVAAGGALGAAIRHGTNQLVFEILGESRFFIATSIENILGCFFIGVIYTLLSRRTVKYRNLNLFLLTGVIGSYTTYSGFMADNLLLFAESIPLLLMYAFSQLIVGLIAVMTGIGLMKKYYS